MMEKLVREKILELFPIIKLLAEGTQCKRKGVGCAILEIGDDEDFTVYWAINGPSGPANKCRNIVGGCGCSHAEPRAIMECIRAGYSYRWPKRILLSTYSPCENCANIVIDSGIIDAVAYEILAEYWNQYPRNANKIIEDTLPLWTYGEICDDIYAVEIKKLIDENS